MAKLTQKNISKIDKVGLTSDDNCTGLNLRYAPPNSRAWVLRITIHGRKRNVGLGPIELITLDEAREEARRMRKIARAGGDPVTQRNNERNKAAQTFELVAMEYLKVSRSKWKNEEYAARHWLNQMTKHAFPRLGSIPIESVTTEDVRATLAPIWETQPSIAKKVKGRISAVMKHAIAKDVYHKANPVSVVSEVLPALGAAGTHTSVAWKDVATLMEAVSAIDTVPARLLEFIILTGMRSKAARLMKWADIDFEREGGAVWIVPANDMKTKQGSGKDFPVPLPSEVLAILQRVNGLSDTYVFPSRSGKPLSDAAPRMTLQSIRGFENATVHGFRATLRTWIQEKRPDTPFEVAEAMLAHSVGGAVSAAYARSQLVELRYPIAEDWARHCSGRVAKVTSFLSVVKR